LGQIDDELGSVRWEEVFAHEYCSTGVVGGDALAPQHGRPSGYTEQSGIALADEVGTDGLGCATQFHIEQLVERTSLDIFS
jgi:hypothetical protein